jgi:hypothetical protein
MARGFEPGVRATTDLLEGLERNRASAWQG